MQYVLRDERIKQNAVKRVMDISLDQRDSLMEVIVRPYKTRRSLEQNKLLHAIFRDISDQYAETRGQRFSPDSWKIYFKRLFLGSAPILLPDGAVGINPVSTTSLSVLDLTAFIEAILHHCSSELDMYISTEKLEQSA